MKVIFLAGAALLAMSYSPTASAQSACNWSGTWMINGDQVRIVQAGHNVAGEYASQTATLKGKVDGNCRLNGTTNSNSGAQIKGSISLPLQGEAFMGTWTNDNTSSIMGWSGKRINTATPVLTKTPNPISDVVMAQVGAMSPGFSAMGSAQSVVSTSPTARTVGQEPTTGEPPLPQTSIGEAPRRPESIQDIATRNNFGRNSRLAPAVRVETNRPSFSSILSTPQANQRSEERSQEQNSTPKPAEEKMSARWEVSLEAVCMTSLDDGAEHGDLEEIFGIAWIKTRVINKTTGKQIDVAPIGGFPRVNGDKERAWFVGPNGHIKMGKYCYSLASSSSHSPIKDHFVNYTYAIDASQYGYKNLQELLSEPRNRIDVMFKLQEYDRLSNDALGTRRNATPLANSNFCGLCQAARKGSVLASSGRARYPIPSRNGGNGILSGFSNGGTRAKVLYSITQK